MFILDTATLTAVVKIVCTPSARVSVTQLNSLGCSGEVDETVYAGLGGGMGEGGEEGDLGVEEGALHCRFRDSLFNARKCESWEYIMKSYNTR